MVRITPELLRRRAEHNDCELSTLEEIALHQFAIPRIECIGEWCKNLKILLLQSNNIEVVEGLRKLRRLQYLNLAANRITVLGRGLSGLYELQKLDLTANYCYDLIDVVQALEPLTALRELYLVGCPVTEYPDYRPFVAASLPQLELLDGKEIYPSERLPALADLPSMQRRVVEFQRTVTPPVLPPPNEDFEQRKIDEEKERREQQVEDSRKRRALRDYERPEPDEAHQTNRTGCQWRWAAQSSVLALYVDVPQCIPDAQLSIDAFPDHVDVRVEGRLLRLRLPFPCHSDGVVGKRVGPTGQLKIEFAPEDPQLLRTMATDSEPAAPARVRRKRDWEEEDETEQCDEPIPACSSDPDDSSIPPLE